MLRQASCSGQVPPLLLGNAATNTDCKESSYPGGGRPGALKTSRREVVKLNARPAMDPAATATTGH